MTTPPACDVSGLIDWPDELGYTRVTAHLFQVFADGCDEGEQPDMKAATGTLTLTYNTGAFKYTPSDASQPTRMIGGRTITCTVLPDGTITNSGSGQTSNGSVIIMATDSERLEPREATVTANFSLSQGPAIQPVTFVPRADTAVNLADLPDMAKSPGVVIRPIVTEDTAVRAEAAALRAEQAAAGVADISQQVEQVQTYATRAETAATSAETAASSAEAASAEAATVTTDAAYIRDVIAQHGTLKGDPGPAPTVEWQGDRLSVNGELGPSLTGKPGQDGGPVPAGGTAGQVITRTADGGVAWADASGGVDEETVQLAAAGGLATGGTVRLVRSGSARRLHVKGKTTGQTAVATLAEGDAGYATGFVVSGEHWLPVTVAGTQVSISGPVGLAVEGTIAWTI